MKDAEGPRWVGKTATLLDKAQKKTFEGLVFDRKEVLVIGASSPVLVPIINPIFYMYIHVYLSH